MSEQQTAYKYTNRLINETSPYLLQHAHNPVDWYPWGEEAFAVARTHDRPILLSIGYAACHWCHVMERESFENEATAAFMNQHFVPIKVDREERPDLDAIYMQAVQAMTGQGGWPMTLFLTPDGRPFYGGTYFPPTDRRYGQQVMRGFPAIMRIVQQAFTTHRAEIDQQASDVTAHIKQSSNLVSEITQQLAPTAPSLAMLWQAVHVLSKSYDTENGGFAGAPKFPPSMVLEFLLRMHLHDTQGEHDPAPLAGTTPVLTMIEQTLTQMAQGGIYDQLGGGFHRYSVDERWLVPHFEKMLYDNALLSRLYLHAYLVTGNELYRRVTEETLDYVLREMTAPAGGFYATQDADSEGEEGKFFLWTPAEVTAALLPEDAAVFMRYYDVTEHGNFEGKNILHVMQDSATFAHTVHMDEDSLQATLARSRATLFRLREQRVRPARDEKVLTAWNGLMLRSFAEAARYLGRNDYLEAARKNARFLLDTLRVGESSRLLRAYKDGRARFQGLLEDYAFLADGLLALYEASFDTYWFIEAQALMEQTIVLFADEQQGGFFDTGIDHEQLISRPKEIMDNALPAGNNVAASVLLRLAAFTGEFTYRERAEAYILPLSSLLVQYPQALGVALSVQDTVLSGIREIALVGDTQRADMQALLQVVNERYLPDSVLACSDPIATAAAASSAQVVALLADRPAQQGKATAYVCQNFVCQAPVTDPMALAGQL
jgi:Highly conserved protein containing a thioredoxin domain